MKSDKVKVKFLEDAFTDPSRVKPDFFKGQEVELSEASANRWIIRNLAVNVKDLADISAPRKESLSTDLTKAGDEEVLETVALLKKIEKGETAPTNYEDMNDAEKEDFDSVAAHTSDLKVKSTLTEDMGGDADLGADSSLAQSNKSSKTIGNKRNKNH